MVSILLSGHASSLSTPISSSLLHPHLIWSFIFCRPDLRPFRNSVRLSYEFRLREAISVSFSSIDGGPEETSSDDECLLREAREAVSQILIENGISEEMAGSISLASPNYVKILIDGVVELDELSLWGSWEGGTDIGLGKLDGTPFSFKMKVYRMAKKKGADGIIPFLESVGLTLSSAMNVARYLSHETLSALVSKVNYMKEIFFSGSDDIEIGRYAALIMSQLSTTMDDDVQNTLSFFEKMGARREGLSTLNSGDEAFKCLIESFPKILLLSLENQIKPMVEFLESIGVPRKNMKSIILLFPPFLFLDIERTIKPRLQYFSKIDATAADHPKMLIKYPWILSDAAQRNCEDVLALFRRQQVPGDCVSEAIKSWPLVLGCSTRNLDAVLNQLDELGVNARIGHVIVRTPQLLLLKPLRLTEVSDFLKSLGLDERSIGRILSRRPEITVSSLDNTLRRKLDYLVSDLGIHRCHFPRILRKYPELFFCDPAIALSPRVDYLLSVGISKDALASMVIRFSPLLGYSVDRVLRPKMTFLLDVIGGSPRDVVAFPRYFSYSLANRIKPRFLLLKRVNPSATHTLADILAKNNQRFVDHFIGADRILLHPEPH